MRQSCPLNPLMPTKMLGRQWTPRAQVKAMTHLRTPTAAPATVTMGYDQARQRIGLAALLHGGRPLPLHPHHDHCARRHAFRSARGMGAGLSARPVRLRARGLPPTTRCLPCRVATADRLRRRIDRGVTDDDLASRCARKVIRPVAGERSRPIGSRGTKPAPGGQLEDFRRLARKPPAQSRRDFFPLLKIISKSNPAAQV